MLHASKWLVMVIVSNDIFIYMDKILKKLHVSMKN